MDFSWMDELEWRLLAPLEAVKVVTRGAIDDEAFRDAPYAYNGLIVDATDDSTSAASKEALEFFDRGNREF